MDENIVPDQLEKFCKELKDARECREFDLNRVSEKSKISVAYLQKLENGEWDFLPRPYIRSFLRTYAQVVGMKVADVIVEFDKIYDELFQAKKKAAIAEESESLPRTRHYTTRGVSEYHRPQRSIAHDFFEIVQAFFSQIPATMLYWIMGIVGSIFVIMIIWLIIIGIKKEPVEEISFDQVVQEHSNQVNSLPEDSLAPERKQSRGLMTNLPPLTLETIALDTCYLRLYLDGDTVAIADIVLSPNMRRIFHADSLLKIVLGSASDMKLLLNEKDLGIQGESKQVVTLLIDYKGIRQKIMGHKKPPAENNPIHTDSDTMVE